MIVHGKERDYVIHNENEIKGFFGDYRFLSNFEVTDIWFEGDLYGSTEAAYMAGKVLDAEIRKQFQKSSNITPNGARKLGQTVVLRSDWENVKYDTMAAIVFDKFYRNKDLRNMLLATGDKYLEETNHWGDKIWGICDGQGKNNLGRILMSTREFWKQDKINYKRNKLF